MDNDDNITFHDFGGDDEDIDEIESATAGELQKLMIG